MKLYSVVVRRLRSTTLYWILADDCVSYHGICKPRPPHDKFPKFHINKTGNGARLVRDV